ncbi:RdRP-domain-containing protein [Sporormia fimetaria CBS 119925]|uniref:RNA-dependent RNA polymerase n=1 Tax=Sporormia fimetaria CBS 119925 TaxID=1340428 RepID=A0A6A6VDZ1_9PLEO|nr:RdRP-domain-containing protein [Sporormia fimetaria CBS 119925]
MDVFLQNVPPHLSEHALRKQLDPYLKNLNIQDWHCHKPKGRNFGNITFLSPQQAEQFLQCFATFTPLLIFKTIVKCKRNNRGAPDPFLLRSLTKAAADREIERSQPQAPERKVVFQTTEVSCGFFTYSSGQVCYSSEVNWPAAGGQAQFGKYSIRVTFDGVNGKQRIDIPYRIVDNLVVSSSACTLTLTLWESPRLYRVHGTAGSTRGDPSTMTIEALLAITLSMKTGPRIQKSRLSFLPGGIGDHQDIIGQTSVYKLSVSPADFMESVRSVMDRGLLTVHLQDIPLTPAYALRFKCGLTDLENKIAGLAHVAPFDIIFQMEALAKNGYLLPWTVSELIDKWWNSYQAFNIEISSAAVKKLFSQIDFAGVGVDSSMFDPDELWRYVLANEEEVKTGRSLQLISAKARHNLVPIYKVNVTPTRTILHGPEPEAKNRILRRFPDHTDYFVRVQFSEEDGSDLMFNATISNDEIFERFRTIFREGINIAGRQYGFLGFSHSSLRGHSAWFMAPFVYQQQLHSYFTVINFLGNTEKIQSPARRAARIGQAFTETPHAVSLADTGITVAELSDVESPDGSRVFSDGAGIISDLVMDAINAVIPGKKAGSTCFQVRYGGAKGMLALDPRLDGRKEMYIRPSMVKFESSDTANLEICDAASKPIPMVLNRQLVKILEDMGLPAQWFLDQQSKALARLRLMTANIANTEHFLTRQHIGTNLAFPKLLRRLERIGLDYRRDRFLSLIVESSVLRELRLLKHKARIPIEHGISLFGIMDETGLLKEGEVFITFDDADYIADRYEDLDHRRVLVTRAPALHPGDVQIAVNVVPPPGHPLRRLRNCIIFSRWGSRDLPSCLSGGDLDGDVYGIIWDERAVQQVKYVHQPADYSRVAPLEIGRPVTSTDMASFFLEFMATDQLGLIATRHIILADQRDQGTLDPDCLELAHMHSTGVDYSKTGRPVDMSVFRRMKMNKYRPDFMSPAPLATIKNRTEIVFDAPTAPAAMRQDDDDEDVGPQQMFYCSDKILGVLYRAIDETKIWFENVKITTEHDSGIWRELLDHLKSACDKDSPARGYSQYMKEAWEIRHAYEDAMWDATSDFSDHAAMRITELEVFTGNIFNKSGTQTRRQRDRSVKLRDAFDHMAKWGEYMIRRHDNPRLPYDDHDTQGGAAEDNETLRLSIACLHVALLKDLDRIGIRREGGEFQSFKVLAASCAFKELDAAIRRRDWSNMVFTNVGGVTLN